MKIEEFNIEAFIRERDAALRSLDKKKITAYMDKYGIDWKPMSDLVFWAVVHKARLSLKGFTEEEKMVSAGWLASYGFIANGLRAEAIRAIQAMQGMS